MVRIALLTAVTAVLMLAEPLLVEMVPSLSLALPELGIITFIYFAYAMKETSYPGAAGAVVLGYLMDLLCGAPVGTFSFAYVLAYFVARLLSGKIFATSWVVQGVLGALFSGGVGLFVIAVDKWLNVMDHSWSLLGRLPVQMVSTGLVTPLYLHLLWRIDRRLSYEAQGEGVFK